ncbi:MAG: hypothetical protein QNI84_15105 [Henriciella sp.]|nr:hypothetical protein [Henriciella sp.]
MYEAFEETRAIASGTRCEKYLFSLSFSPPEGADTTDEQFFSAIQKAEERLNLVGQPRVIVVHEKGDHRDSHAHVVWSRIDAVEMKAIPMPFNKLRMKEVSRELFVEHGHEIPRGLLNREERNPLNYTFEQYQHAKRIGKDAKAIKSDLLDAWSQSDDAKSFNAALEHKGYRLARGDRRGFVVLDIDGEVYSLPKWLGIKTKAVRDRLGEERVLPRVDETKADIGRAMSAKMDEHRAELRSRNEDRKAMRSAQRKALVERQRGERKTALDVIAARQIEEAKARQAKFRTGLSALWDWVRGENKRIKAENEVEAAKSLARDQAEREALILKQREQRHWLATRQKEQAQKLRSDYEQVSEDRTRFEEMAVQTQRDEDERREAFKRKRRPTSARKPRRSRNKGPEPDL